MGRDSLGGHGRCFVGLQNDSKGPQKQLYVTTSEDFFFNILF